MTLSDEEFALLYTYLDRMNTTTWDPDEVGETTRIGRKVWPLMKAHAADKDDV